MNAYTILNDRGFIKQCSDTTEVEQLLSTQSVRFYVGFDPTADSLHIGSLVPIMAVAHLQRNGHIPICIIGGGTTMIGDPSGKTQMRKMLTYEQITENGKGILKQLERYIQFNDKDGMFLNNADWLLQMKYIDFLRDIGKHFRVNDMIRSEAYKQRMDRQEGLSFIEFNYQLLQAYDFLYLNEKYNCTLQMGGDDQWGNIIAGKELTKKSNGNNVYGLTFPLLTTATGSKMGKTEAGTVWLDAEKTSPYEFYQYWINTHDKDVIRFLKYFTFLELGEIEKLEQLQGAEINQAKEILAYEATKLAHGKEEADKAREASKTMFGSGGKDMDAVPSVEIGQSELSQGIPIKDLLAQSTKIMKSKAEVQRFINQGGIYINNEQLSDSNYTVSKKDLTEGAIIIRIGKKKYYKILPK